MSEIAPAKIRFQNLKDGNMFLVSSGFSKQQKFCFDSSMSWSFPASLCVLVPQSKYMHNDVFNRCVSVRVKGVFWDGMMTYPGCIASRPEPVGITSSSHVMLIRKWPATGNWWVDVRTDGWMDGRMLNPHDYDLKEASKTTCATVDALIIPSYPSISPRSD